MWSLVPTTSLGDSKAKVKHGRQPQQEDLVVIVKRNIIFLCAVPNFPVSLHRFLTYDLSVLLPNSSAYLHLFFLFTWSRQAPSRFCPCHLLLTDMLLLFSTPLVAPSLKTNLLVSHNAEL